MSEIANDRNMVECFNTSCSGAPPFPPLTGGTRDSLALTFLFLHLPECRTVMRYSIETSNRLMVHLAELINSYVEAEKASGDVKEVVSPSPRPQMTSKA